MGPYDLGGDWSDKGIVGVDRFVQRLFTLANNNKDLLKKTKSQQKYDLNSLNEFEKNVYRKVNQTVNKYDNELENFRFNTAVAFLMELLNEITKNFENVRVDVKAYVLERFIYLLAPLAPHFAEEVWEILGSDKSIYENPKWFKADKDALVVDTITIVIQVSGKVRGKVEMPINATEEEIKTEVWKDDKVKSHTEGKTIVKEIYIKGKIYNIVAK
jgi:leucyl-tRNA synthetase